MGNRRYQTNGFIPVTEPPARRHILADTDTIVKGDFLHDDGNGKATNAIVAFALTALGVAAADCDNSGDEGLKVEYYPIDEKTQYIVPVEENAVITQTAVGLIVDLENNDDIDISDAVGGGVGFFIDGIDISTNALAANTKGYAIGHLLHLGAVA